jgi:hypothetical protein
MVLAVFRDGDRPNSYRLSQEPCRSPRPAHRFRSAIRLRARDFAGVAPLVQVEKKGAFLRCKHSSPHQAAVWLMNREYLQAFLAPQTGANYLPPKSVDKLAEKPFILCEAAWLRRIKDGLLLF